MLLWLPNHDGKTSTPGPTPSSLTGALTLPTPAQTQHGTTHVSSSSPRPAHVCQKWREIALGAPSLWTVIRKEDDECAMLCFIHRSWNLPLDGSCPIFMRELDGFAALIAPHAPR